MSLFRKAAEQGYAPAQTKLGEMYRDGVGVTQDYDEAVIWFRKAAEQGNVYAQLILEDFQTFLEELKEREIRE